MFVRYTCQPVVGALLWGSVVRYASVVDYPNIAFLLADLSSACGYLSVMRGAARSMIVAFLSTVSCEVTGLSAKETCEDFSLSVLLDGSSWVPPFSTSPYSLLVSISSWEEIFCFSYPGACSPRGSIHRVWVSLGIPPLVVEWLPVVIWSGLWFGFETISSVPHVNIHFLLVDRRCSPLFVCCGLWDVS
jgi:hypothetical protein